MDVNNLRAIVGATATTNMDMELSYMDAKDEDRRRMRKQVEITNESTSIFDKELQNEIQKLKNQE
jgi:hypothetical protein